MMSGGGFSALVYIGVIRYLQQESIDIPNIAGTSMGSVFALLYSLGVNMGEFEKRVKSIVSTPTFRHYQLDWIKWIQAACFEDGQRFVDVLDGLISPSMTFMEHAKHTGKNLVVCATCITTMQPVYFSVDTTPQVVVLDAIRASCAIPGIIQPVKIGSNCYIDGAIVMNVPVLAFGSAPPDEVLIFTTFSSKTQPLIQKPGALEMMMFVLSAVWRNASTHSLIKVRYKNYISFSDYPLDTIPFTNFCGDHCEIDIQPSKIDVAIAVGYTDTYNFFKAEQQTSLQQQEEPH